ncbi:MAG: hypothetical protein GF411_16565 [Candidatus Lokiarchaeota archaeon]|nr:hypothetical protein [Candidatus Lokiarchaeota archaeon]
MTGGSGLDPYYDKDPPKLSKNNGESKPEREIYEETEDMIPKTYKDSVRPKRIEIVPSDSPYHKTKKVYSYDCEHCGTEIVTSTRKKHKHALCDKDCQFEWQKYGKPPSKLSPEGRKSLSRKTRERWEDPEHRAKRLKAHVKAVKSPEYRAKMSRIQKEVSSRPEWKEKQSRAHKGKKRPPEVGRKVSAAKMGHPVSEETRRKLSEAMSGDKHPQWKGGISSKT